MVNHWLQAVKMYNAHEKQMNPAHKYHIPRKGTPAHAETVETMEFLKANPSFFTKASKAEKAESKAILRNVAKAMKKRRMEKK